MCHTITIRPAARDDLDAISLLVARSYRALLAPDYDPGILRDALPLITRPNPSILGCGTYFVAEDAGRIVASGGWTDLSPHGRPARRGEGHVRQVATDPDHARRGLGRRLMAEVIASAEAAGVSLLRCQSTLTGQPFYRALGFEASGRIDMRVAPGVWFPAVQMHRAAAV
ncbi:acetyltransferase [Oceanicola sp. 22II-s10i]|uniref:GNAT family N-acetyltransferase n=1 Tax=Oceanicola sp. 22II-s10i TaxID=1317116 RepID=UPI000B527C80|nr:GNAT family N-acetyltransferase [Oceanicola sp. 22II-s10i]OWU86602.1 acetyltransferase [Oceanicola sp. 22II-s10i]